MATILLIHDKNNAGRCFKQYIHEEHECDLYDYLTKHNKRRNLGMDYIKPNKWFEITLGEEDIKEIKNTTWYHNNKEYVENEIKIENKLEFIELDDGYRVTIEVEDDGGNTIGFADLYTCKTDGDISIADTDGDYGFNRNDILYRIQLNE